MNSRLISAWEGIEEWLSFHAPNSYASLNRPAREADISRLEEEIGLPLCDDMKASLRRHNGALSPDELDSDRMAGHFLPRSDRLLSVAEIREHRAGLNKFLAEDEEGMMVGTWWHPQWIPFTVSNSADALFIDHQGGSERGNEYYACVGEFGHDGDRAALKGIPLSEFLQQVAQSLTDGHPVLGYVPVVREESRSLGWRRVRSGSSRRRG